jgi:hypothetical protein
MRCILYTGNRGSREPVSLRIAQYKFPSEGLNPGNANLPIGVLRHHNPRQSGDWRSQGEIWWLKTTAIGRIPPFPAQQNSPAKI